VEIIFLRFADSLFDQSVDLMVSALFGSSLIRPGHTIAVGCEEGADGYE